MAKKPGKLKGTLTSNIIQRTKVAFDKAKTDRQLKQSIVDQIIIDSKMSDYVTQKRATTLIRTAGSSNKFYQLLVEGNMLRTCYGRIGTSGNYSEKDLPFAQDAYAEYNRLLREKKAKGYEDPFEGVDWPEEVKPIKKKVKLVDPAAKDKFDAFLSLLK